MAVVAAAAAVAGLPVLFPRPTAGRANEGSGQGSVPHRLAGSSSLAYSSVRKKVFQTFRCHLIG